MKKEEIERIALEVSAELGRPCVAHYLNTFATRFIERIDAERGKAAHCYTVCYRGQLPFLAFDEASAKAHENDGAAVASLFLSPTPTIPDEVSYHNAPGCLNTGDKAMWTIGWNACRDAMLAATGELGLKNE